MNSGTVMALGIMAGVMIAAWFLSRKARKRDCEYDEMQLKIRAKGYQIGFYTVLFLMLVLVLLSELNWFTFCTPGFAAFAALIISVTVFAVYCILHDAFIGLRSNPKQYIILFSLVILAQALGALRYWTAGELLENGRLTFGSGASSVMVVCFLTILITLIVKIRRDGKEAEE